MPQEMGLDGKWVTVNGAHIFIKDGETPVEALRNRLEDSTVASDRVATAKDADNFNVGGTWQAYNRLTPTQKDALTNYTGDPALVNVALRGNTPVGASAQKMVKSIDQVFAKQEPLKSDIVVYRFMDQDAVESSIKDGKYSDKGYVSTTRKWALPRMWRDVGDSSSTEGLKQQRLVALVVPKGTRVFNNAGDWNTYFQHQAEILLPRGHRWTVKSIDDASLAIGRKI